MNDTQERLLDARDLKCPLPVLKARRALREVPVGGVLRVLVTDPGAPDDFRHFCRTTGTELVEIAEHPDHAIIRLRRVG